MILRAGETELHDVSGDGITLTLQACEHLTLWLVGLDGKKRRVSVFVALDNL